MVIKILQIIVSILLMLSILLQNKGTALSGIFGGNSGNVFMAKRGLDKVLFYAAIVLSAIFLTLSLISIIRPF